VDEMRSTGRSFKEIKGIAGNRNAWSSSRMLYATQGEKGLHDYYYYYSY
jgi:hypothetical protein